MQSHINRRRLTVSRRKKEAREYHYECTLTGDKYTVTQKVENPDELVSVNAWYEMHPEQDDRPEAVKIKQGIVEKSEALGKE